MDRTLRLQNSVVAGLALVIRVTVTPPRQTSVAKGGRIGAVPNWSDLRKIAKTKLAAAEPITVCWWYAVCNGRSSSGSFTRRAQSSATFLQWQAQAFVIFPLADAAQVELSQFTEPPVFVTLSKLYGRAFFGYAQWLSSCHSCFPREVRANEFSFQ